MRFLLAGVGNRPASREGRTPPTATATEPTTASRSRPVFPEGGGTKLDRSSKKSGGSVHLGEAPLRAGEGVGRGLYWLLQGARDDAICTANVYIGNQEGVSAPPSATPTTATATAPDELAAAELAAEIAARRKAKKERNKNKAAGHSTAPPNKEQQRSEVGAGRALFGGFVPSRRAPKASLYDFGSSNNSAQEGRHGGTGSTSKGGSLTDVSSLASIYSQRGAVPGGAGGGGGGTLQTLDDARVRQYTQEATTRAHRLGAEKRNSRISKSKRQG